MILINTFKLIGLVGPNINISNRYIQLNNFLLAKTYEKCIFSHFCEKLLNLINGAITYICDCIYVNLYMVFITQVRWNFFKIFLINNILELRIILDFFRITIKSVEVSLFIWISFNNIGFFPKKETEINRINNSVLIALRAYEFGITGPYSH